MTFNKIIICLFLISYCYCSISQNSTGKIYEYEHNPDIKVKEYRDGCKLVQFGTYHKIITFGVGVFYKCPDRREINICIVPLMYLPKYFIFGKGYYNIILNVLNDYKAEKQITPILYNEMVKMLDAYENVYYKEEVVGEYNFVTQKLSMFLINSKKEKIPKIQINISNEDYIKYKNMLMLYLNKQKI